MEAFRCMQRAVVSPQIESPLSQAYSSTESQSVWVTFVCLQVGDGKYITINASQKPLGEKLFHSFQQIP